MANNKPHNWCAALIVITKYSNSKFRCDTFTTWLFFKVSYKCKQFMSLSCIYSGINLAWDVSFLIRFFTNFWYKSKKRDSCNKNILVRQPRLHGISSQQEGFEIFRIVLGPRLLVGIFKRKMVTKGDFYPGLSPLKCEYKYVYLP